MQVTTIYKFALVTKTNVVFTKIELFWKYKQDYGHGYVEITCFLQHETLNWLTMEEYIHELEVEKTIDIIEQK